MTHHGGDNKQESKCSGEQEQLGGGGHFVEMQSAEYDLVLNVLLGIRRGLADLSNRMPEKFVRSQFEKKITLQTDWVSTRSTKPSQYMFTEYAPEVFQKLRHICNVRENDY